MQGMDSQSLTEWFAGRQMALSIDVKEVGLSAMHDWAVVARDGKPHYIGHSSGKYHRGVFLQGWDIVRNTWIDRFMIAPIPPQDGVEIYGIALLARYNGKYLVQAKAEPGNATPGHVQLTSTIQASRINIEQKLSGDIAFTWMYDDPRAVQFTVSQDGAQLYMKRNKVYFLELTEDVGDIPENFAWATLEEIFVFAKDGLVSEHIMQCLGASLS